MSLVAVSWLCACAQVGLFESYMCRALQLFRTNYIVEKKLKQTYSSIRYHKHNPSADRLFHKRFELLTTHCGENGNILILILLNFDYFLGKKMKDAWSLLDEGLHPIDAKFVIPYRIYISLKIRILYFIYFQNLLIKFHSESVSS